MDRDQLDSVLGASFICYLGVTVEGTLMGVPAIYVWTHDSIGLGEDGPTHQPVEQLASLRAIPGLDVVRPGDANEVAVAWRTILENTSNPAGIVLTRQNIPTWERGDGAANGDSGTPWR